jgi:hypothetical protein
MDEVPSSNDTPTKHREPVEAPRRPSKADLDGTPDPPPFDERTPEEAGYGYGV